MAVDDKRVALIGSSGGGIATLGHTQAADFVKIVAQHLQGIRQHVHLDSVLFVSLDDGSGLDSATGREQATLLYIEGKTKTTERKYHGTLDEINEKVKELETRISRGICNGEIHGLISVSSKPSLFAHTLSAAGQRDIPVTGTGGTSLAAASSEFHLRLIGNSGGSVATTPETKAVSFSSAFAREWGLDYDPRNATTAVVSPPSWRSVLNASLPAFWSVALLKRLFLTTSFGRWDPAFGDVLMVALECHALPIVCAVTMAASRRKTESVLMGAVLAGCACSKTVLGGLLAGWIVARLEERVLYWCILDWNLPATMTNLLTSGFTGVVAAVLMAPISPFLSAATAWYRDISTSYLWTSSPSDTNETIRLFAVSLLGSVFCYGSKIGWYHSIFLPLILIEMELGDASMTGALDLLTLVLVSAGVCLGLVLTGTDATQRNLGKRGSAINLLCGDFIEACYPHMEQNTLVSMSGYLASACSAIALSGDCKSSAYLPLPAAIWLADDWRRLLVASAIAIGIPFGATIVNYVLNVRKASKPD